MGYLPDNGIVFNFMDEKGMLMRRNFPWENVKDNGKGDGLFRTGIASVVYKDKSLIKGILSCFKKIYLEDGTYYYQAYRYPYYKPETVSRDQISSALVGLYMNYDFLTENQKELVEDIRSNLRWRLSDKFNQTIDFWLWHKSLGGNKLFANMFCFLSIVLILFVIPWNKLLRLIAGFNPIPVEDFQSTPRHELTFVENLCERLLYPAYALFLWCWQIHTTPNNIFKPILKKLMLVEVEKTNYVLKSLMGGKVDKESVDSFKSFAGFRWIRRLDKSDNSGIRLAKPEEVEFNDFNKDLLIWTINLNKNT